MKIDFLAQYNKQRLKLGGSFAMPLPVLLHQIFLKFIVCTGVSNFMVHLHETSDSLLFSHQDNAYAHSIIEGVTTSCPCSFSVMRDQGSKHDVSKVVLISESKRSSHHNKFGLQNSKCPLNIFPSCRLSIVKIEFFLKSTPPWIDPIR